MFSTQPLPFFVGKRIELVFKVFKRLRRAPPVSLRKIHRVHLRPHLFRRHLEVFEIPMPAPATSQMPANAATAQAINRCCR